MNSKERIAELEQQNAELTKSLKQANNEWGAEKILRIGFEEQLKLRNQAIEYLKEELVKERIKAIASK